MSEFKSPKDTTMLHLDTAVCKAHKHNTAVLVSRVQELCNGHETTVSHLDTVVALLFHLLKKYVFNPNGVKRIKGT